MENYLFEKMSVPKAYMKLALPVVLSMIVSLVYNMVDTYFIALTGVQELVAGVSLVAPMFTLMIAFGDIFGLGGSSAISRLLGEKKDNEAKKTCAFCIWISLVFGLCISAILLLFRTQILGLLGVGKDTYQYANAYYTWIAIGAVSIIFSMVPSNILRTEGLAVQSMAGSIIGSIVNIIFDPIFIFGLNQGAAGAAMATVLGNIIADIYYVYAVMKKSKRLTCSPSHMKVTGRRIRDILMIGIPASITNIMQTFMMVMTNNFLLTYGTDKVAAMGIALKVNMITALVLVGFAFGGQPLVGYNYGAKNEKRLKNILKFAYLFEMGLGLLFTIFMSTPGLNLPKSTFEKSISIPMAVFCLFISSRSSTISGSPSLMDEAIKSYIPGYSETIRIFASVIFSMHSKRSSVPSGSFFIIKSTAY